MYTHLITHLEKVHKYQETDFRWRNLRKLVKDFLYGNKILDAGCGTGHMALDLVKEKYEVTALDYSEELVGFARAAIKNAGYSADVFSCDLTTLQEKNLPSFDSVICLDVIEHIERDSVALKNLYTVLKPGGNLIISVPAMKSIYGQRDKIVGHYRRYDKAEFIKELEDTGFTVSKIRYWNFIGILPVIFFEKVLHKPVNEEIRYSKSTVNAKIVSPFLDLWFTKIERYIRFPVGLTLFAVCKKNS